MPMRKEQKWLLLGGAVSLLLLLLLLLIGSSWTLPGAVFSSLLAPHRQASAGGGDCSSHGPSIGGNVVIAGNQVVCSELIAFGGTVAIHGTLRGDVVAFGGTVIIDGTVHGDINLYGGVVALQSGSHVYGDLYLYDARWAREHDAQLDGAVIDHPQRLAWFPSGFSFPTLGLLIWVGLGLLLTWLLPEHVMLVRTTLTLRTGRSLLVGLLSAILAPVLILLLGTLIISIPLAIIVALGFLAGWALGTVALGLLIGERLLQAIVPQYHARPVQVAIGLVILTLAGSLPTVGWLISLGAGLLGLGAVLLSRFGTRLYGELRYPLIL
jgi:hypothetical protein